MKALKSMLKKITGRKHSKTSTQEQLNTDTPTQEDKKIYLSEQIGTTPFNITKEKDGISGYGRPLSIFLLKSLKSRNV